MPGYPHLNLTDWPFRVIPDDNFCVFMADRSKVKEDLDTLLRNLSRRNSSSIHLLWAWFGAGKTHTLLHMKYLCKNKFDNLFPVYMEFPKTVKSFIDVYRGFIYAFDPSILCDAYLEVATSPKKDKIKSELQVLSQDLSKAIQFLCKDSDEDKEVILKWLRGEKLELKLLRDYGISRRIETDDDAIRVITWIIKLINFGSGVSDSVARLIWVIDEFQRIEQCRQNLRDEINSCLHSTFNKNPNSFSLIISFSGIPQKRLPSWFSKELEDRIGIEKVITLPPLMSSEAVTFVKDVLTHFRYAEDKPITPFFPFTKETVEQIIDFIQKKKFELKPRILMQFFSAILQTAEPLFEEKKIAYITFASAEKILKDMNIEREQEE